MLDAEAKMSEAGVLTLSPGVREDSGCHPSSQLAQQQGSFLLPLPPACSLPHSFSCTAQSSGEPLQTEGHVHSHKECLLEGNQAACGIEMPVADFHVCSLTHLGNRSFTG